MNKINTVETVYKTEEYIGRSYGFAWFKENNPSSFYDRETDQQCYIPTKTLAELRKELGV